MNKMPSAIGWLARELADVRLRSSQAER